MTPAVSLRLPDRNEECHFPARMNRSLTYLMGSGS